MENRGLPKVLIFVLIGGVFLFIFGSQMYTKIQPGYKGVMFYPFSIGLDTVEYDEGIEFYFPWNEMIEYSIQEIETFEKMEVLSKNGLSIKIDLSIIHHPSYGEIADLHQKIGENYLEKIIKPAVRSVTREVIGEYLPEELYSTKRVEIEEKIFQGTSDIVNEKHISLPAIYIRDVTLPQTLKDAIEQKLKQEQESLEYEFKIDKAEKEAERKEIEANGIAKFQEIVNKTITPQLLKWKGVEATQEIAKSTNSKVIVIGNGDGDLPIILGGQ